MTDLDLSPAADDVVFAFNAEHSGCVQDSQYLPAIAAALRALASKYEFADVAVNKTVAVVRVDDILAIAAELENN
jgi:hypothetical protein